MGSSQSDCRAALVIAFAACGIASQRQHLTLEQQSQRMLRLQAEGLVEALFRGLEVARTVHERMALQRQHQRRRGIGLHRRRGMRARKRRVVLCERRSRPAARAAHAGATSRHARSDAVASVRAGAPACGAHLPCPAETADASGRWRPAARSILPATAPGATWPGALRARSPRRARPRAPACASVRSSRPCAPRADSKLSAHTTCPLPVSASSAYNAERLGLHAGPARQRIARTDLRRRPSPACRVRRRASRSTCATRPAARRCAPARRPVRRPASRR